MNAYCRLLLYTCVRVGYVYIVSGCVMHLVSPIIIILMCILFGYLPFSIVICNICIGLFIVVLDILICLSIYVEDSL